MRTIHELQSHLVIRVVRWEYVDSPLLKQHLFSLRPIHALLRSLKIALRC
jgi:hypothetical protein